MKNLRKIFNILNIILLTFSFIASPMPVFAATTVKIGTINADAVIIREGPGVSYPSVDTAYYKNTFVVLEIGNSNVDGCPGSWLLIEYSRTRNAYICGSYVDLTDVTLGEEDTRFPESYRYQLAVLKALHPNWTFNPLNVNLDFNTFVGEESSLGRSLIQLGVNSYDGWKNLDSYDYINNTFFDNYPGGGPNWYAASPEIIAYYSDPRNFLYERRLFMFETLSFNPEYHTLEGLNTMLSGTFMSGSANRTAEDTARGWTYAQIFMEAARINNVSPYFLAARVIQEIGSQRTTIVTGTVPGYEGYYNYYNIGATGYDVITNGLNRAKNEGWNSEFDAIVGGAAFISNSYIQAGQDTNYTQKWDVIGPNYYTHQYMQNIQAPAVESSRVFSKYRDNNLLNRNLVFTIPVFNNMPINTAQPNPGNPNNYLKSLSLNEMGIMGFNAENLEYTINVPRNINMISVSASPYVSLATISGTGEINLPNETNVIEIPVTAQNGTVRKYKLNIIKINEEAFNIDYIMQHSGIKYDENYVKEIIPGTSTNAISDTIKSQNSNAIVTVKDVNNVVKTNQKIGTGDTVTVSINYETKKYSVVIYGDVTGSGDISIIGLLRVQKMILNQSTLSKVYEEAADVNHDGKITIIDLLRIQKHILGESSLY